jgi:two-component system chemotaxis sensor kinase CheA
MDTRMVPIGPLFGRFKRVVRDITRVNNKDINLVIHGEKTELDKRMIDELGDPLIHMVRNAADHGIESPAARTAAGKPAQGTLTLDAFHRGNSIIIQVADDGKGLDKDRILAKAIEKKLISAAEAEKMTAQQAYQLIWEPGFSTAEKITEISGRGMGMDIVRSKIEDISGTVEVDSQPGQGTTFTIKLPLTLAILPSLMAEIDGDVFALPVESIIEIVSVPRGDLSTVHGVKTAVIRQRVVSIVELDEIFSWNPLSETARSKSARGATRTDCTLVVLGQEGREIGLRVDALLGEEDVVIKSMAENYRNVPGIAGASILGSGRVSLILDVAALIAMSSHEAAVV